jgi:cytosine/adenosine deaminase-related metal-dependent hydrolase
MIYLRNARYFDPMGFRILEGNLLVHEGTGKGISLVETIDDVPKDAAIQTLDCSGKLVMRSFVNGHHHAYSALACGMPQPAEAPRNFSETLQKIWWRLDKALTPDMIRMCGYVTAIASAKAGVTFVIDHHASPFAVEGSLDLLAEAFEAVGVSHLLCYEISDRDGLDIAEKGLAETDRYLQIRKGLVGLHASFTVGNETLNKAVDLARKYNTGIHVHVAEDPVDQQITQEKYGQSVVRRFEKAGLINLPGTILAHCLHLSAEERKILSQSTAFIAQNCESNLNNKVGFFTAEGLNPNIMLGTDGMHSDMLRSSQASYFTGLNREPMDVGMAYKRLFKVHDYLSQHQIDGDAQNNLVIFDYDSPTPITRDNFLGHLYYGLSTDKVQHVISNGRLIVSDRKLTMVDEAEMMREAREMAKLLWKKL